MQTGQQDIGLEIANLVYQKYESLKIGGKPQSHEWTVLAAIVEEICGIKQVIVVTTGTKCVGQTSLSPDGLIVNDCHAEILSRRCFIRYLINQVSSAMRSKSDDSIFIFSEESQKYVLKKGIRYHLYISQSPCGYASEFMEHDGKRKAVEISNAKIRFSKRQCINSPPSEDDDILESMHRSGAKFANDDPIRLSTKPGRGDPCRSYSCSDKLCLYNHIGYQGSLLGIVIDPIFMSTITISGNLDEETTKMALFNRIQYSSPVPTLYHDDCPSTLSNGEVMKHLDGKKLASCGSALLWIYPNTSESLIAGKGVKLGANVKKGVQRKQSSILSSFSLFHLYSEAIDENLSGQSYWMVKQRAKRYQQDKGAVLMEMKSWKSKNRSFYQFLGI